SSVHSPSCLSLSCLSLSSSFFFFNDPATTEIYTLSLHDALPIFMPIFSNANLLLASTQAGMALALRVSRSLIPNVWKVLVASKRSEEHTSELQSRENLVCRLLLEKKKKKTIK